MSVCCSLGGELDEGAEALHSLKSYQVVLRLLPREQEAKKKGPSLASPFNKTLGNCD